MGKIIVITNLTLDGVMQAPGASDEDPRDGFNHGGWASPWGAMQQPEAGAAFANMGALLFGRLTYERFYDVSDRTQAANVVGYWKNAVIGGRIVRQSFESARERKNCLASELATT